MSLENTDLERPEQMSRYDDIIHLPHHVSTKHPPMSMHNRAAQFAPFAALTGYDDAVAETARTTEEKPELDEQKQKELDAKLRYLTEQISEQPQIRIKYFIPDTRKNGGSLKEVKGKISKISLSGRHLILCSGNRISFADLLDLVIDDPETVIQDQM